MLVEIKIDMKKDIDSFYDNIFGEDYIKKWWHIKKAIYRFYPKLEQNLNDLDNEQDRKRVIFEYISKLYNKYYSKLELIKKDMQNLFDKNINCIVDWLCNTMDFPKETIQNITINLSFKPNSTFWPKVVNLSIALEIFKDQKKPYLDIFIHEITHIIRNQKIWEIYNKIWKLSTLAHEDLKEIITPVIMRDNHFKNILQSEYMKNANEKQQLLNIFIDWITYNIVDYFEMIYKNMKSKWSTFEELMIEFVKLFLKIEDQIIEKHGIYNEIWFSNNNREEYLKLLEDRWYFNPIILSLI